MKIDSFNRLHIGLYSKKNMNASAVRLYVRMCDNQFINIVLFVVTVISVTTYKTETKLRFE